MNILLANISLADSFPADSSWANSVWAVLLPLVDQAPNPEDVKPGWLGFTVFMLLAAAMVFLGLSLRKHLRRVDFEEDGSNAADPSKARGADPSP